MLDAKNDFFVHLKWLRRSALASGADLIVAGDTMQALIRRGQEHLVLQPLFISFAEDGVRLSPRLLDESNGFAGWLPQRSPPCQAAADRTEFRRQARAAGLPVPGEPAGDSAGAAGVLVRRAKISASPGYLGPYRSLQEHPLDPAHEEFYEPFIEGHSLAVWFWKGLPVCAEQAPLPSVTGDGVSTVRELVARATRALGLDDEAADRYLEARARFLALRDATPSTILASGTTLTLDAGQLPPLRPQELVTLDLRGDVRPTWYEALREAGQRLSECIPEPERATSLFLLEAVLDSRNDPWLLAMHANPVVHPLVYPAMLFDLLGPRPTAAPTPVTDAPRA